VKLRESQMEQTRVNQKQLYGGIPITAAKAEQAIAGGQNCDSKTLSKQRVPSDTTEAQFTHLMKGYINRHASIHYHRLREDVCPDNEVLSVHSLFRLPIRVMHKLPAMSS